MATSQKTKEFKAQLMTACRLGTPEEAEKARAMYYASVRQDRLLDALDGMSPEEIRKVLDIFFGDLS